MSTTPNNPAPLTDEQVEAYIRQVAAEEAKKFAPQPSTPPAPQAPHTPSAQPFKMAIAGNEYTFNTPEEASAAMNNILEQQQKLRETQNPQGRKVTSDDQPEFNIDTYVNKMKENPVEAQEYVMSFSPTVKQMSQKQQEYEAVIAQMQRESAVYQFKDTHPDYVASEQNAQAINGILSQYQIPWTAQGLDAAYTIALQRGLFKTEEAPAPPAYQPPPAYNPYSSAPPVASRTTSTMDVPSGYDVDNLPLDAIENIFVRFQK